MAGERTRLSDVQPTRVEWLWPGRIPLGKLTLLDGDPGLGKSTVVLDLAARGSVGGTTPTGERLDPFDSIIVTAEDAAADTIRPRLDRAGADPRRVFHIADLSLPEDAEQLERHVAETGARLVVIDPVVAHLGDSVRTASDHAVRRALVPLAQIAEEHGCAVLAIRHLRKQIDGPALYRGGGSIAFSGTARSVLAVARDPDDDEQAVLAVIKGNLAKRPAALTYRLVGGGEFDVACVEWLGESVHDAESLLGGESEGAGRQSKVRRLADDIGAMVRAAGGRMSAAQAEDTLTAKGWVLNSGSQLSKARLLAGVVTEKAGFGEGWTWRFTGEVA